MRLLRLYNIDYTENYVSMRLGGGYNYFYRNHKDNFTHFTVSQEKLIRRTINETLTNLKEHGFNDTFGIDEYLHVPLT